MKNFKSKVYQYTAFFELNENGGYTVTIPTLPGLVTEGRDLKDAKSMAEDAIRCYLFGLNKLKEAIPLEREMAQFRLTVTI